MVINVNVQTKIIVQHESRSYIFPVLRIKVKIEVKVLILSHADCQILVSHGQDLGRLTYSQPLEDVGLPNFLGLVPHLEEDLRAAPAYLTENKHVCILKNVSMLYP